MESDFNPMGAGDGPPFPDITSTESPGKTQEFYNVFYGERDHFDRNTVPYPIENRPVGSAPPLPVPHESITPWPAHVQSKGAGFMSKDRPIKSFRIAGERPFKTYNPVKPFSSLLFADPRLQELPLSLPSTLSLSGLMQQQQTQQQQQHEQQQQQQLQQQQQRQSLVSQLNLTQQRSYGEPAVYRQPQGLPNGLMAMDPTMNTPLNPYSYDDLDLEADNGLMRSDLMVTSESLIQQREQDLNIQTSNAIPDFIVPNRSAVRAGLAMGGPDPLGMLFDPPMTSFSSGLQRAMAATSTITSSSAMSSDQFVQNLSIPFQGVPNPSNGNGRSTMSSTASLNIDHFPVKQEADEGSAALVDSPSPSSLNSPTHSEQSADGYGESNKRTLKRSTSECSSSSTGASQDKAPTSRGDQNGDKSKVDASRDPAYLEKRRKNNESAKRSREARRTKEELVAFRVISLEEENMKLRAEIRLLDKELDELRTRLYQCN